MPRTSTFASFVVPAGKAAWGLLVAVVLATGVFAADDQPASPPTTPDAQQAPKPAAAPAFRAFSGGGTTTLNTEPEAAAEQPVKKLAADPPGMTRLSPNQDVWLDATKKRVVLDGAVCLREGYLEMFVCPRSTKEHESIIAVDVEPHIVHAGLLAIGAKAGSPAKWQPTYEPASGSLIDITLIWTDEKGAVHRDAAQQWIRNNRTQKALESTWIFGGSSFGVDGNGAPHYRADDGDFICVSNFPDAMLDLPVQSSEANEERTFEAFTEHIPPKGTRVRLVLTPRLDEPPANPAP